MADAGRPRHRTSRLPSGVTVCSEDMPSALSTALGVWVRAGAALETDAEAGRAHLLEHMLFRGTPSYPSAEIDQRFDAMGGDLNAATSRDEMVVVCRVPADDVERALPILGEMVGEPLLEADDLETERRIVLEEIAMVDDDPEEALFEIAPTAVFGAHPLGRPVIGSADVVASTTAAELTAFHHARYRPERIVVSAAGRVDHDRLCALVERLPLHGERAPTHPAAPEEPPPLPPPAPRLTARERDTGQAQVALVGRGLPIGDDRRFVLRVLDTILGGTASSRLFRAVREDRGLAYAVSTFDDSQRQSGLLGVHLGTRREGLAEALSVVADELERVRTEAVGADELQRAKEHSRARLLLALESTSARMQALGRALLHEIPVLTPEEIARRVEAVSAEQVLELAADLYAPAGLGIAAVGPGEGDLREAAAPLGGGWPVAA